MIKRYIITDGHFSKNGNFIGITSKAENIHIYKKVMDLLNLKSITDISFPLFAFGEIEVFDKLTGEPGNANREKIYDVNGITKKFERLTAMGVFASFVSFIDAYTSPIIISEAIIAYLKSKSESLGDIILEELELEINSEMDKVKEKKIEAVNAFKEYLEYKISSQK